VNTATLLCNRCKTKLAAEDLRCSICGQAAPVRSRSAQQLVVQLLRCTGCGAALAYDPQHQAPSCSFCGSVVKVEQREDPMEQTEGYLPFTLSPDDARSALKNWLGSLGWFRPSDLRSSSRLEELKPLWWVAWVFDAEAMVSWAADSNAGAGRSSWAPHSGQADITFDDILVSASRGLTVAEVERIASGMNLATKRPEPELAEPEGAEHATIEQFDLQRSQARQQITSAIHSLAAQRVEQGHIPGSKFRNLNTSVVLRDLQTRRLSLPAYVLAYRYKESLYRVVICGQDARLVVGSAPYSLAKIVLVAGGCVVAVLMILAMIAMAQ
jgi:hypothetical protein